MEQSRQATSPQALRERLTADVTVVGHAEQALPSGRCVFFGMTLFIKPISNDIALHRVSHTLGSDDLTKELLFVLVESLHHELAGGGRFGLPLESLSISITSVEFRGGPPTEVAARLAVLDAFKQFLQNASLSIISA